ncbi:MAG: TetR/AcrR family transcriptional repressor of lmrAB and yxaGH operons [Acidimicrobiales bacterium]|jgi:TetR/AcrR family transcriptional repressor of lmrAB and yxaGH operons
MRPQTIDDLPLVDALSGVFSRFGYEGANLNRLAEASGLKRASLYHRFPGGKDEIVAAVVGRAAQRFEKLLAPAFESGDPIERAERVAGGISAYYEKGARSCLIVALSVADEEHQAGAVSCVDAWAEAFTQIAVDAGSNVKIAEMTALDAVAAIEGALVISATTGQTGPFERTLASLPARLTNTP